MVDNNLFLPLSSTAEASPYLNLTPEQIAAITPLDCTACKRSGSRRCVIRGGGSYSPDIMFIGLQPTVDDNQFGRPYMGERGMLVDRILEKAGIPKRNVYFTYLAKCYAKDAKPKVADIRPCSEYLDREIRALKPKLIITEGSDVLKFLLKDRSANLNLLQGSTLELPQYPGIYLMPVVSVDAIYADYNYEPQLVNHFRRAARVAANGNAKPIPTSYVYIDSESQLDHLFDMLKDHEHLTLDIETNGKENFMDTKVVCWAVAWAPGKAAYFPWLKDGNDNYWPEEARARLIAKWNAFLANKKLILHNGKYDLKILRHDLGLNSGEYYFDTVISSNIIDETQMSLKLKNLAWTWTDMGGYDDALEKIKQDLDIGHDYSKIPRDILKQYVCGDVDCTYRIFDRQRGMLTERKLDFLMFGIYMPVSRIFMQLEYDGVKVDLGYLSTLHDVYDKKLQDLKLEICKLAGVQFDIDSSSQLSDVLFKTLKLPSSKMGKFKESADKESLNKLKGKHPVIEKILEYRATAILQNNFIASLRELADSNGFVHTSYNIGTQDTSRTSSSKPNLQNLPRSNKDIKKAFVARPGYVYYEFDFSQIEIRVLAHLSQDPKLIADLNSGADIHRIMASTVYGIPPEKITSAQRSDAKSVSFGIIYGMSWKTLAANKGMTMENARKLYNNFFKGYSGVANWIEDVKNFARKYKCVYTPFNRIRHLDSIDHPLGSIRSKCERCAVNSPIQSMGADIPNLALIKLLQLLPMQEYDYKFCFQIHDAVVLEMRQDKAEELAPRVKYILETAEPLCVPTPVGCKRGPSLGDMEDYDVKLYTPSSGQ